MFEFLKKKENKQNSNTINNNNNGANSMSKNQQNTTNKNKSIKNTTNNKQKAPKVQNKKVVESDEKITPLKLYDWIISSIQSQKITTIPDVELSNEQISIDWGKLVSKTSISKIFVVEEFSWWTSMSLLQILKESTLDRIYTVKFNSFVDILPYSINWDSPKMKQQVSLYSRIVKNDTTDRDDVFTKRQTFGTTQKLDNKIKTFQYFQDVDLINRRKTGKFAMFIQITGQRDNIEDFDIALQQFRGACLVNKIKYTEITADILDWARLVLPTSMRDDMGLSKKIPYNTMSDDTIAVLQGKSQGKIGKEGVPIGMDVYSSLPVFHVFREDKDKAENVLISAGTGGGKSVFVKNLILWLLQEQYSICVLDYEGDEYTNLAKWINKNMDQKEAIVIDMKAGNGTYFDPLRISSIIGDNDNNSSNKAEAVQFTKSLFKILLGGKIDFKEEIILSQVITRVYAEAGVTDNPKTWRRSKKLDVSIVYKTLCRMIEERKHWITPSGDDSLQKIATDIQLRLDKYFIPGESDYGTFKNILNVEDLWNSRFIVFSFGNKGADSQNIDETKVALKQLCVSKVTNEISNYNKYVKNKFTVKIWEEVQRFVNIKGAEDIMLNCITGGRKRGDIAFIITNNLAQLLDGSTDFMKALKTNLTGFCIGYIKDEGTRHTFCETFDLQLFEPALKTIAFETSSVINKDSAGNIVASPFKSAFLVKMDATNKSPSIETVVKAAIHPAIFSKNIFDPGKLDEEDIY